MIGSLLVMRHGPAETLGADHAHDRERRLSAEGRRRMARGCAALARLVPKPQRVFTSPYLRAQETAALLTEAFGSESPEVASLLAPGFDRLRLVEWLQAQPQQQLAIVAHEPDLSGLIAWLSGARIVLDPGTACLTELARPGTARVYAVYPLAALERLGDNF